MAVKNKRHSMVEALKEREDVRAFLQAGESSSKVNKPSPEEVKRPAKKPKQETQRRVAVTLRLPEQLAHALIDVSAERRKNREKQWSQQDIVAEALAKYLKVK